MKILKFLKSNIGLIIILGLIARVAFNLFFAKSYYGTNYIYTSGDTYAWANSFVNFWEHGHYNLRFGENMHEYGYFFRMPGYSFFIGFFWLICGKDWSIAYPLIGWLQTLIDVFNIFLFYQIAKLIFKNEKVSLLSAFIYAFYPFVIVWNPLVYSEMLSITLTLSAILLFLKQSKNYPLFVGILLGIAALTRPQVLFLIPIIGLLILYRNKLNFKSLIKNALLFGISVLVIYGSWPLRNYINHGKVILTQDLRGAPHWDIDVISFMQYIYSIKTEWEPQMSQILAQEDVDIPEILKNFPEEAAIIHDLFEQSKSCAKGFSYWKTAKRKYQQEEGCTEEVALGFQELRAKHIKMFPLNFYVILPMKNLQKALFKFSLYDTSTYIRKIASSFFIWRSILIVLGILGLIFMYRNAVHPEMTLLIAAFFLFLYIMLCAGTSPQMRNIEVRYFVHADILLLLPASYFINSMWTKWKAKKTAEQ
jgi:hypothetical protein